MPTKYKLVFFGSPRPAAEVLKYLSLKFQPVMAVSQPDRPVGREKTPQPTPVTLMAEKLSVLILKPLRVTDIYSKLEKIVDNNTFGFLYAYGQIIPKEILSLFPRGVINLHPSLLPKYRGASPIRQAIIDGRKQTGFSLMLMDDKMDHGPIIYQRQVRILPLDTRSSLWQRITQEACQVVNRVVFDYLFGKIDPQPQDPRLASYTKIFRRQDGLVNWNWPVAKIERFIRAMRPWPAAFTWVIIKDRKLRLKLLRAKLNRGLLDIETVQLEGKKPSAFSQFKTAYYPFVFIGQNESQYQP